MSDHQNIFPKRLKVARLRVGISQGKLGILSGLEPSSAAVRMNQYEKGVSSPKFSNVVKIAKVLGVPTSYLYEPDEVIAKIILDLGSMSSQDRKAVSDFSAKRAKSK